jgi:hypothetical protein
MRSSISARNALTELIAPSRSPQETFEGYKTRGSISYPALFCLSAGSASGCQTPRAYVLSPIRSCARESSTTKSITHPSKTHLRLAWYRPHKVRLKVAVSKPEPKTISRADRIAIIDRTSGSFTEEEGDELARIIEDGCEQVDERDWWHPRLPAVVVEAFAANRFIRKRRSMRKAFYGVTRCRRALGWSKRSAVGNSELVLRWMLHRFSVPRSSRGSLVGIQHFPQPLE